MCRLRGRNLGPALLVLLLLGSAAAGAPQLRVKGRAGSKAETYYRDTIITVTVEGAGDKVQFLWDVANEKASTVEAGSSLFLAGPPGDYRVVCTAVDFDAKTVRRLKLSLTIVDPSPPPPPPPPPPPGPNGGPSPFAGKGLRVLILYDARALGKMPREQESILYAKPLRDYLNATCPPGEDGKTRDWRIWDASVDASAEAKVWQDALARPRKSVPWIVVGNGRTGYEGPLPANVADTLTLVKKYAQ